jgi:hypothetical protein
MFETPGTIVPAELKSPGIVPVLVKVFAGPSGYGVTSMFTSVAASVSGNQIPRLATNTKADGQMRERRAQKPFRGSKAGSVPVFISPPPYVGG